MRYLAITFLFLLVAVAGKAESPHPILDSNEPVFQLKWGIMPPFNCWPGGAWEERSMPDGEIDITVQNQLFMAELGRKYFRWGSIVAIVATIAAFAVCGATYPKIHDLVAFMAIGAASLAGWGILIMQAASVLVQISFALGIAVVIAFLILGRNKGWFGRKQMLLNLNKRKDLPKCQQQK